MRLALIIAIVSMLFFQQKLNAQGDFYDSGVVPDIHIRFSEQNWKHILDSLFTNTGDEGKLKGDVTIDGQCYKDAGIRYKGYSSYNANVVKNPFNIDLDYCIKNQNHMGYTKIKLSNVIHDPSFVREALAYEIARIYFPASKANYARLFINDTLIGLYTNVEAVDHHFLDEHFQTHANSFFKGEPLKLVYPFGENANLAYSHGTDSSNYFPFYKEGSETGWNDLLSMIRKLDISADSAARVLNIDQTLWMHAFNEVLLNLDSYIGYAQNYYIYQDNNGRFNPIVWDLNMSFGSFRESDGSYHFLGLSIDELKQLDPLEHLSFSVSPRPLITKLLSNQRLQKMYFAHIKTILNNYILSGKYYIRGKEIQIQIDTLVAQDTNRFYSYADFLANMDTTVGGTGSMIKYPGIRDLMEARTNYLQSLPGLKNNPVISNINHAPEIPFIGDSIWITARITNAGSVSLGYRNSSFAIFSITEMTDDGKHHDGAAGDSVYGAMITPEGKTIQYYIYAENDSSASFSPEKAEFNYYILQPEIMPGDIVINELCSEKSSPGNWVELLNTTRENINLSGFELTDDRLKTEKLVLPDTIINSKSYLVIPEISEHSLFLWNNQRRLLDSVIYSGSIQGKTIGRYPNGYGPMYYMIPTPAASNYFCYVQETGFLLYPNPAKDKTYIEFKNYSSPVRIKLFNILGQIIRSEEFSNESETTEAVVYSLDLSGLERGIYMIELNYAQIIQKSKLIID